MGEVPAARAAEGSASPEPGLASAAGAASVGISFESGARGVGRASAGVVAAGAGCDALCDRIAGSGGAIAVCSPRIRAAIMSCSIWRVTMWSSTEMSRHSASARSRNRWSLNGPIAVSYTHLTLPTKA